MGYVIILMDNDIKTRLMTYKTGTKVLNFHVYERMFSQAAKP